MFKKFLLCNLALLKDAFYEISICQLCKTRIKHLSKSKPKSYHRMKYRITIQQDEDCIFVAKCPSLPGCISQGKTRDEVLANIRDAMNGYLQSLKKHGEPPPKIEEELVEPSVQDSSGVWQRCNQSVIKLAMMLITRLAAMLPKAKSLHTGE